ncbi:MAG: DUF896 domain-containing protein [Lachnospiraceae bacterium]|nr:DUF896 domain-containing protein [Lachnospiraceae bacterium]
MTEKEINRINELYHKSKAEGLTEEEKAEQAKLRQDYILAIRKNLRGTLDNVSILEPDGTVTELRKVAERKEKRKKGS